VPIRYVDRVASCRAVFSRVRAQVGDEAGERATTYADRETAYAGASPDDLPRAVSRSRSCIRFCRAVGRVHAPAYYRTP